jgi:hypothetical protein
MFELELVSLQFEEQFKDGIFEPGEKISVRSIAYKNVGPMPTPPKSVVFSLVEKGNISGPSTPIRLGTEASLGQNQVFSKSIANNIHSFVLSTPENAGDRFGFQPAVKMGTKVKTLDGGREYTIQSPIVLTASPNQGSHYVTKGKSTSVTLNLKNQSNAAYGASVGLNRALKIRISPSGGSIPSGKGKFTINGLTSSLDKPLEFDVPSLNAAAVISETLVASINGDVQPEEKFKLKVEVLVAPAPGQPASKVLVAKIFEFVSSLDPAIELSLAANVKKFQVRCKLKNPIRERQIDEIWITKAKGSRKVSLKFDTSIWWFWNDSPSYEVDLNQINPFLSKVQKSSPLDAISVRNLFRTIIIPASAEKHAGTPWQITSCDIKE